MEPMSHEYFLLLDTFLSLHNFSHSGMVKAITHFFKVKDVIYENVQLITMYRQFGFVVIFIQFTQLVNYMNVHPRV